MRARLTPLLLAGGLACFGTAAQASESASAVVTIRVNNPAPTCRLEVPAEYYLGQLTAGPATQQKKHAPFAVKWFCDNPVRSGLKATLVKGYLRPAQDQLEMVTGGVPNGTLLWLEEEDNRKIKLSGSENDAFCVGQMAELHRECTLTPVTEVHASDRKGLVEAAIRFDVVYLL